MFPDTSFFENNALGGNELFENIADRYFGNARVRAILRGLGKVIGMKTRMPNLSQRLAGWEVRGRHEAPLECVELDRIIGTESRADDFDAAFNPASDRTRARWVNIARLHLKNTPLPAVELIRVGRDYFVRDGHHRISVARAFGVKFIEANITVLDEVAG